MIPNKRAETCRPEMDVAWVHVAPLKWGGHLEMIA
jgi:hypothetical protein